MIADQNVTQDDETAKGFHGAHHGEKDLRLFTAAWRSVEDGETMNKSRDAVVSGLTLGFDTRKSHNRGTCYTTLQKCVVKTLL
jgi:hypothetical protein